MTIGPEQRNAEMRGGWIAAEFGGSKPAEPTLEQIHKRLNSENIDLRGQLEMSRKATSAAQELLEATRSELAKIEADGARQAFSMGEAMGNAIREKATLQSIVSDEKGANIRLRHDLDTERLLRTNDASTIADLQRQLKEAEGQLKAQREAAPRMYGAARGQATIARGYWHDIQALQAENAILEKMVLSKNDEIANLDKQLREAKEQTPVIGAENISRAYEAIIRRHADENTELRRTFRLILGTTKEYFDFITEIAADPADEKRKEPKP